MFRVAFAVFFFLLLFFSCTHFPPEPGTQNNPFSNGHPVCISDEETFTSESNTSPSFCRTWANITEMWQLLFVTLDVLYILRMFVKKYVCAVYMLRFFISFTRPVTREDCSFAIHCLQRLATVFAPAVRAYNVYVPYRKVGAFLQIQLQLQTEIKLLFGPISGLIQFL